MNACVLKQGGKTLSGVVLDGDLTDQTTFGSVITTVFGTSCPSTPSSPGTYAACSSGKLWYNPQLKTIIFGDLSGLSVSPSIVAEPDHGTLFFDFLTNPLDTIITSITNYISSTSVAERNFDSLGFSIGSFKRLYISKKSNSIIHGYIQPPASSSFDRISAVIDYKDVDVDVCTYADKFSDTINAGETVPSSGVLCTQDGNDYHLLLQGSPVLKFNPENAWEDFTAKIRSE